MSRTVDLTDQQPRFAAIVPIESTPIGIYRGVQLLNSLTRWEPGLGWSIFLEDSQYPLHIAEMSRVPTTCVCKTIFPSLNANESIWRGRLTAGILNALHWMVENTSADFVLRVDTDAVAIAPFAKAIRDFVRRNPMAGVVGVIGASCNPRHRRLYYRTSPRVPRLIRAYYSWPPTLSTQGEAAKRSGGVQFPRGYIRYSQLFAFDIIRPHIANAMANGYQWNEDCQGGACVVTRQMAERMMSAGYFSSCDVWSELPFADDQVLAMYAYAAGLQIVDCSQPGQPFGVQGCGLAYSPEELIARGYSLIHSVKSDTRYNEASIRKYFADRASQSCQVLP
jgi:hypothetical protein